MCSISWKEKHRMSAYFIKSVFFFSIFLAFKSISFITWYPESPVLAVEFIFA